MSMNILERPWPDLRTPHSYLGKRILSGLASVLHGMGLAQRWPQQGRPPRGLRTPLAVGDFPAGRWGQALPLPVLLARFVHLVSPDSQNTFLTPALWPRPVPHAELSGRSPRCSPRSLGGVPALPALPRSSQPPRPPPTQLLALDARGSWAEGSWGAPAPLGLLPIPRDPCPLRLMPRASTTIVGSGLSFIFSCCCVGFFF